MKRVKKIALLLGTWLLIIGVLGEIGVRLFVELPPDYHDEKTACFRFDDQLGWFPQEGITCVHSANIENEVINNSHGFRDQEFSARDTARKSIAFLGDSFVWGYDVEDKNRFTNRIQAFLPNFEIYNMGVSGYGTDQEFLLLQRWYPKYRPDIVCLVIHSNDVRDLTTNYLDLYYKPYFELEDGVLALKGTPVPTCYNYQKQQSPLLFKSHFLRGLAVLFNKLTKPEPKDTPNVQHHILREMKRYLEEHGSTLRLIFTYEASNQEELDFLRTLRIPYQHLPTKHKFKTHGQHWTAQGHEYISSKVLEQLYMDSIITEEDINKFPEFE